jgi:hypothetical protein
MKMRFRGSAAFVFGKQLVVWAGRWSLALLGVFAAPDAMAQNFSGCYISRFYIDQFGNSMPEYICPEPKKVDPGPKWRTWPTRYYAIAMSKSTSKTFYGWDFETLQEAEEAARVGCNKKAGVADCNIAVSAPDNVCITVALSRPEGYWASAKRTTIKEAQQVALNACGNAGGTQCQIVETLCPSH